MQHFVRITEPWPGKFAKRIGTRSPALHSTFYFRRKSRRSVSFLIVPTSKTEEVSQNCFIFDVVNFKKLEKRPLDSPGPYGTGPQEPLRAWDLYGPRARPTGPRACGPDMTWTEPGKGGTREILQDKIKGVCK